MKTIIFYNSYSGPEVKMKERIESRGLSVEFVDVMSEPNNPFKPYIRATPARIIITDDMQGEFLLRPDVDFTDLIEAEMMRAQDLEELTVHGQNNNRLDLMVKEEKQAAADQVMSDLSDMGVI